MELAMVGLGKMGANMAQRLLEAGHRVVVTDTDPSAVERLVEKGATGAGSLSELAAQLEAPRAVWVMVPSGDPTESVITALADTLDAGDLVIDGGNSNYRETMRRGFSGHPHCERRGSGQSGWCGMRRASTDQAPHNLLDFGVRGTFSPAWTSHGASWRTGVR